VRLKEGVRNRLIAFVNLLSGRGRSSSSSNPEMNILIYWIARIVDVNPIFISRAQSISREKCAPKSATKLLVFYIRLSLGLALPGFAYNIAEQLETDEERSTTILLLSEMLSKTEEGPVSDDIRMQILRLKNCQPDNEEMIAFCNHIINQALESKTINEASSISTALRQNGKKALVSLKQIFDSQGKRFFLSSGTLLGAIREKDFIGGDLDIDLGVFADEISKDELKKMFVGSGFYLDRDFEHELGFLSGDGVLVEFFFCERDAEHVIMRSYGQTHEWLFSPFELISHEFLGHQFLIPDNYEKHLRENFGNWEDKTIFFNWAFDVPCSRYGSGFESLVFLAINFRTALERGDRYLVEKTALDIKEQFGIDCYGAITITDRGKN